MWHPLRTRREARERVAVEVVVDDMLSKRLQQLASAAGQPEPPPPCLTIRLGIESAPEVEVTAADYGELSRLLDWVEAGPYSDIADALRASHDN